MYTQRHTQRATVGAGGRLQTAAPDRAPDGKAGQDAPQRRQGVLQIAIEELDRSTDVPLHRQLFERLRDAIVSGRLAAGVQLPSTRALHEGLGISRNTAIEALTQLAAEGYVTSVRGSGTFVADAPPETRLRAPAGSRAHTGGLAPEQPPAAVEVSERGRRLWEVDGALRAWLPPVVQPFDLGPSSSEFPARAWRSALAEAGEERSARMPQAGGEPELREALTRHVRMARGLTCSSDQLFVVRGPQTALDVIARVIADAGDHALVEDPGFPLSRLALTATGVRLIPVDVDDEGFSVDGARATGRRPRMIVVRPACQFPLGMTMSMRRRRDLLTLAGEMDSWIVEDDGDSWYRYEGNPLTSLHGLDGSGRVILFGSLSDLLFPFIQLAYVVVPRSLVDAFVSALRVADAPATVTQQTALAVLLDERHLERLIRRVRQANQLRRDALVAALQPLPPHVELREMHAGTHLLLLLPYDDARAAAAAETSALHVGRLSSLSVRSPRQGLLLGYAAYAPGDIHARARDLRSVLMQLPERSPAVAPANM